MSLASCHRTEDGTLVPSSGRWNSSGMGGPTGSWTLNTSEFPNAVVESSLSQVLEVGTLPPRFFLSPKACAGILRRAERRGKQLPPMLEQALSAAIAEDKAHTLNATHETQTIFTPVVIDRAAFNQGQNAQYEPHIEQTDVMDSLVARGPHAVGVPHTVQASELRLKGQINPQDTCPTLLANTKSGDNDPLAVHAITFQPGNLRREAGADPSTTTTTTTLKASMGDQMPHVACFKSGQGAQARSIGWSEEVSPTLPSNAGGNTAPAVIGLNPPMAVRRLTPVECERLQGFPDNWSQIPWKGKPAEQCPDGPRYKCAGNSMAVPVMRWIGEQIARVELSLNKPNA